jgi:hypothetical protein
MATLRPGLLALSFAAGTLTFAACGDDGNFIGSDEAAGSSGQAAGGSAGAAHAGTTSTGGGTGGKTSNGGTTNTGGTTSNGGTTNTGGTTSNGGSTSNGGTTGTGGATCETGLCARPNTCLDKCGGEVVYTGCCQCVAPAVNSLSCGTGGQGGSGSGSCVGMTCDAGQSCVAHRTVGGALFPPGPEGCPDGSHVESQTCQSDFGYTCAALTGCTANLSTCHCAPATSCAYATSCKAPYTAAWLDTDAQLVCEQLAP